MEWALLGVIAAVCVVLSILQYHWTGELSRAEPALLRAGLNEQIRRLSQYFNDDLRENVNALLPTAQELHDHGFEEAHRLRYEQFAAAHDRALFSRIGIAVPENGTVRLFEIGSDGHVSPTEWPQHWDAMRVAMIAHLTTRARPPFSPIDSTTIQLPVFASTDGNQELEWLLLDLNEDFVRGKLLPRLVSEYLLPGPDAPYNVSVTWANSRSVIYSSRADHASVLPHADATGGLFPTELTQMGRGRGGRQRAEVRPPRWTIAVRHSAGSLDVAVAAARLRNLIASLVLVGLLGGTAWALVRYTARSRRLSEMQFRFAVGVSHELRTPLTAIRGAAFNLADRVVTDPVAIKRYYSLILRNAEELTSMIENVLAFSASLHSGWKEPRETFAVADVLKHAAAAMSPEIEQAGCRFESTIAPDLPAVSGDRIGLELAFRNLIANAARHAAQGGWIGLSAERCEGGVEVRVCDRGPGISEEERERVFEPFYRGKQTRAEQVRGTGVGLSLVKDTVERHRGTIAIQNSPGGGAQFTVRLPAIRDVA